MIGSRAPPLGRTFFRGSGVFSTATGSSLLRPGDHEHFVRRKRNLAEPAPPSQVPKNRSIQGNSLPNRTLIWLWAQVNLPLAVVFQVVRQRLTNRSGSAANKASAATASNLGRCRERRAIKSRRASTSEPDSPRSRIASQIW